MQKLGNTYKEVISAAVLGPEESAAMKKMILESFESFMDDYSEDAEEFMEELMGSPTAVGEYSTGIYYLIEDLDDLQQMIAETGMANLLASPTADDIALDMALFLNKAETMAAIMQVTGDYGGDIYVIPGDLLEEYPEIKEHINVSI